MEVENEQRLMDEIRQGNKDAFRTLVNPLIPKAYRTAYMMLQSKPLAEEAVQNALIELYSTIVSGKEINRLHGWFSRLLSNRAVDIPRKEQGNKYLKLDHLNVYIPAPKLDQYTLSHCPKPEI
ncbi:hypothetical protein RE628_28425 [Paenibacillus sp. D2_2]|uniref:RNA polymerase sigma factor n=1 Tax=Paenibacillus sp. D2_2 TaxID=3073092 RepID=UPI0028150D23|nr:hypothetical protein [Paenibacillus sp. D2_2]WMT40950.1 hypothetical protein RE628_28425 [Paenibacillus sp. D2_2]